MAAGIGQVMVPGQCGPQFSNGEMLACAAFQTHVMLWGSACVRDPWQRILWEILSSPGRVASMDFPAQMDPVTISRAPPIGSL